MKCDTVALKVSISQIETLLMDLKKKIENYSDKNAEDLMLVVAEIEKYNNRVLIGINEYDKAVNKVCNYVKRISL